MRDPEKAAYALRDMGMPLYRCEPPTGWPDRAEAWVNVGALAARLKAAKPFADRFKARPGSQEGEAIKFAYSDSVLYALPIIVNTPSGGSLVDMTRIFMSDDEQIPPSARRQRRAWCLRRGKIFSIIKRCI